MGIREFDGKMPRIAESAYIDPAAVVIGDVTIGEHSSLWPMVVTRGDVNKIVIGDYTNIQDGTVMHVTHDSKFTPGGYPLTVDNRVTVGHKTILHACTVGNLCLIGMAATVMDGAVLQPEVVLGAGSLVPSGKELAGGYLWLGVPARRVRALTDRELEMLEYSAAHYARLKDRHKASQSSSV